ncbi:MAG: hypothetical protein AAGU75_07600 [Bacillota bacterium]
MKQSNHSRLNKSRIKKSVFKIMVIILFAASILFTMDWLIEDDGAWSPDYKKVDLADILEKKELTEKDYQTILMQTGLGRDAADELIKTKIGDNRIRLFEKYQDDFFSSGTYECRPIAVIVREERIRDKNGNLVKGFDIPSLQNGDILITKATHSLGWRHGHAAIVTNAAKGETLEAIVLGNPSIPQNISKWRTYPSFILLRLKDDPKNDAEKIAAYAKKTILNIPYGLLTGIPNKAPDEITKTQCSHLVWYPYKQFGYDIDSDGSWLVTPKDIAGSDLFEVVQVYGINPEEIWQ